MRLNNLHHALILDFAEQNTQIITNNWTGLSGNKNSKNLWDILANKLNSLGYGTLSITEYKRRLTDWKSKTKGKAASLIYQVTGTGGGPKTEVQLTDHEKRLLALMGNISYEGDNVREVGVPVTPSPSTETLATHLTAKRNKNSNLIPVNSQITCTPSTSRLPQASVLHHRRTPALDNQYQSDELDVEEQEIIILENIDENEIDIPIINMDHDYDSTQNISSENKDPNKKRKLSPRLSQSKSSKRRAKVKGLSNEIKAMNDETLSILKDIKEEFSNVNRNLTMISSSLTSLTKAVCNISEKFNYN